MPTTDDDIYYAQRVAMQEIGERLRKTQGEVLQVRENLLRQIVREEIDAALERHDQRGLDNLQAAISEPLDEQEEMAAVLATLTPDEWEALIQRVKERKQGA